MYPELMKLRSRKARLKKKVKPRSFYTELAEYGLLEDFLKERLGGTFYKDDSFRTEMYEILYEHSPEVVPELEIIYLDKMCETLSFFLEYTRLWRKPQQ